MGGVRGQAPHGRAGRVRAAAPHRVPGVGRAIAGAARTTPCSTCAAGSGRSGRCSSRCRASGCIASDVDPVAAECARLQPAGSRGLRRRPVRAHPRRPPVRCHRRERAVCAERRGAAHAAEARLFERPATLDGGADGLELHRRIAAEAARSPRRGRRAAHRGERGAGTGRARPHAVGGTRRPGRCRTRTGTPTS